MRPLVLAPVRTWRKLVRFAGHLDYWKLLKHLVPIYPQQRALQRDVAENVARSMDQAVKSSACHKPCYDSAWVADMVASRESRVSEGEAGTQFQPFNSGRPVTYTTSKYLKNPPSKYAMQGESCQQPPIIQTAECIAQAATEPDSAASGQEPALRSRKDTAQCITREVPVLSVLPKSVPQPTWVNRDASFQEITRSEPKQVAGREESIFSELRSAEFAPGGGHNASSVPIFYKLKGMDSYETKPLPFGGPFWPGFVESQPEDLAPPRPKTPTRRGPLPLGDDAFWSGAERPQSAPRISLRRDYPVPPLFSEIHSEVNLRKAGQKERVLKTWIDTVGQGASATPFVGEGDHVLSRSGMQGSCFSRPSSAILPLKEWHQHGPSWKSGDQPESRPQTATCLAHAYAGCAWAPESLSREKGRPQTVNSIARGSPAENLLSSNCERKLVSAMKRPSTAQSVASSSARSGVTFSPFPSRPCTPRRPASSAAFVDQADHTVSSRIRAQSQLRSRGSHRGDGKSVSVRAQRLQAQLWEDVKSVRLLV